ncbi:MAG: bifunctional phosphoribosyl-AMP cyclohydrolase/phosphoribosyl-ATP diphosphatase HisIE [Clostridiales bacterium]|nr:bifunctional phosphoribosyl-AMP cyclohydrolase/phosphoribosyl-ATP diphosphatase HisIE [Clostridiales bacterium]
MDFADKIDKIRFNPDGLIPVVTQDATTKDVLMVAWANGEAINKTLQTGEMWYFSRSRRQLWHKGETSGHFQKLISLSIDCDDDTLLATVEQIGAACHTGNATCFFNTVYGHKPKAQLTDQLESLREMALDRKAKPVQGSYTNYLFEKGIDKILKKVGEESAEVIIAAKNDAPAEIAYETADLLYHLSVMLVERGVTWTDICNELLNRKNSR